MRTIQEYENEEYENEEYRTKNMRTKNTIKKDEKDSRGKRWWRMKPLPENECFPEDSKLYLFVRVWEMSGVCESLKRLCGFSGYVMFV